MVRYDDAEELREYELEEDLRERREANRNIEEGILRKKRNQVLFAGKKIIDEL